jgi:adenosylhomocysteinase
MRSTSLLLAGKNFVVCGYGWVGRGIALRAKGMGSNVIVTEVDPIKALEAIMDGFRVMTIQEAAAIGDIFVTATGCVNVIQGEHFKNMKDGVILANSGHFDVEISKPDLVKLSDSQEEVRPCVTRHTLNNGKRIYLLGEGRLINLACAEGHPPEVMDMSFANQALCAEHALSHRSNLTKKIYNVPFEIDHYIAELKLQTMGITIDVLTEKQEKYLNNWKIGT